MPLYDFQCQECKYVEERFTPSDVHTMECPNCEGTMNRLIGRAAVHLFREGWYEHVDLKPRYFTNKKDLRHFCRERGLTSEYAED